MTTQIFTLHNDHLKVTLSSMGASVLSLFYIDQDNQHFPILKPSEDAKNAGESALFPLIPFANRIQNNTFLWQDQKIIWPLHSLDQKFFLHGNGWINEWTCIDSSNTQITFELLSTISNICAYRAKLTYQLQNNALLISLAITNLSQQAFPFGLGFHPFFHITDETTLQFNHQGFWTEDQHHLPLAYHTQTPDLFDFTNAKLIHHHWINNGYDHWDGSAVLQHSNKLSVILKSDCNILQVYQPEAQKSDRFICLEPQTHPVNAHNQKDFPGLSTLMHNESKTIGMRITVKPTV